MTLESEPMRRTTRGSFALERGKEETSSVLSWEKTRPVDRSSSRSWHPLQMRTLAWILLHFQFGNTSQTSLRGQREIDWDESRNFEHLESEATWRKEELATWPSVGWLVTPGKITGDQFERPNQKDWMSRRTWNGRGSYRGEVHLSLELTFR